MKARTYGTVTLEKSVLEDKDDRFWQIECEPQVALRFKRVFPKVRQSEACLRLTDTPENARELSWFLQRYPMKISKAHQRRLDERAEQHRVFAEDIGRILSGTYKPSSYAKLALPLREYQQVAVDLANQTRGLLVGDDVGLGKTALAIGALADPARRPALVVSLTHLGLQWKKEIERFLPGAKVHILKKGTPYPLTLSQGDLFGGSAVDVLVCNYHKLDGWAGELAGLVKSVVFDEAHELRHDDSKKYRAAKKIANKAEFRLGLTATPIFNMGIELFSVMEVLSPGALGNKGEFSQEWIEGFGAVKDPKAFGSFLREQGLFLRRTRAEVGRELPALSIIPHVFDVSLDEINRMVGDAADLARIILAQGGMGIDKLRAAEDFSWRLRQATGIAKAPLVADFIRMLIDSGEQKIVCWAWHHEVYKILQAKLSDPLLGDLKPVLFTGEQSITQKEAAKQAFVEGDSRVLLMSLRAGAGIDGLQKVCSTGVMAEPDWSPSVGEQCFGRLHRDGQGRPVFGYFPLANCGSDPVIADVLGLKRAQLEGIRDPTAELIERSQVDPDKIKKLAADFLRQRGEKVPEAEEAA